MTTLLFPAPDWPTLPVEGADARFPVRRVFCVGRNYVAHAAEMGAEVDREAPFYFTTLGEGNEQTLFQKHVPRCRMECRLPRGQGQRSEKRPW